MRVLLTILFSFTFLAVQAQELAVQAQEKDTAVVDWRKLKFTHAKAYLYGLEETTDLIIKDGKLHLSVVDPTGVPLNKVQIDKVLGVVMGEIGEENMLAFCFAPHHGIVFYNEVKPVGHISICFDCYRKIVVPPTAATKAKNEEEMDQGIEVLKQIIVELGLPVFKRPEEYYQYGQGLKSKKN